MKPATPQFRPLPPGDPEGGKVYDRIPNTKPAIEVPRVASMPCGQCHDNVLDYVAENGGTQVTGYLMIVWPGYFSEALHHSVVRTGAGDLVDVTAPAYSGLERYQSCWFTEDVKQVPYDGQSVKSEFTLLCDLPPVKRWMRAARDKSDLELKLRQFPHERQRMPNGQCAMAYMAMSPDLQRLAEKHRAAKEIGQAEWRKFAK